jgi:hypothetical protein
MSAQEVADRYHELARQGKWFEIQDELFADDVKSVEPADAPILSEECGRENECPQEGRGMGEPRRDRSLDALQ